MAILKPETDKPLKLTLKYKSGLEKPGRTGKEFLFTLTTGDVIYLPPIAADEIKSLNLAPQEPFLLTKRLEKSKIVWSVERVQAGPKLVRKEALMNQLGEALAGESKTPKVNQFYLDRAVRLIDVFAAAHKHAVDTYGGTVSKEDVRALVTTVFIQCTPKAQTGTGY